MRVGLMICEEVLMPILSWTAEEDRKAFEEWLLARKADKEGNERVHATGTSERKSKHT